MLNAMPLVLAQAEEAAPPTPPPDAGNGTPIEGQPGGTVGPGGTPPTQTQDTSPFSTLTPLFFLLLLVVLFVVMSGGQRKEKKRRAAMLEALKKGDKVQTVGGIIGTVVEVREQEIVVKVDENANTRLRFARSAIQNVLEEKEAA